ncbi:MAG: hypothetical protein V2A34_07890, partial [Lentisphaerota bacterium]
ALSTGGSHTYVISLSTQDRASFTLAYSDYPGTAGAGKKLVNDLDLLVSGPGGAVYYPNGRASPDRTNNVEGIDITTPSSGIYTVKVSAFNVPMGTQSYALVFSGGWTPLQHTPLQATTNTVDPYAVDAIITSLNTADSNSFYLFWNTTGTSRFESNQLMWVGGNAYQAFIPAQPRNTTVFYYLQAVIDGQAVRYPTNAPAQLSNFYIGSGVTFTVSGKPAAYGSVTPSYGAHPYAVSNTISASAPAYVEPGGGLRYACTGWTGSGSAPSSGNSNAVTFTITTNSLVDWRWAIQYNLLQSSSVPGILYSSAWHLAGVTRTTLTASASANVGTSQYRFAYWTLNGSRKPDDSSVAVNPIGPLAMTASYSAVAYYFPPTQDSDGNGMADWWEYYYFGLAGAGPDVDSDGDTFSNLKEFRDDTNPRNGSSYPRYPGISFTPLAVTQTTPAPWPVTAVVTDNYGLASVILSWNRNGGGWQSLPLYTNGITNTYTNAIPAPGISGDTFLYQISASDHAGLSVTNGPHFLSVSYPILTLSPPSLGNTWIISQSATNRMMSVINSGHSSLTWSLRIVFGQSTSTTWLATQVTNGTLSSGSSTSLVLSLNASNLPVGHVRSATLIFDSNDPGNPSQSIPLTLSVTQLPVISHTPPENTTNTVLPYVLTATLTPSNLLNSSQLFLFWSTNIPPGNFSTGLLSRVSNDLFQALAPAQPAGTRISYYLSIASTNGFIAFAPTNAPSGLFSFEVTPPLLLSITGTPVQTGAVTPDYGNHEWASGSLAQAVASLTSIPEQLSRYYCTGWVGQGSAPSHGGGTSISFVITSPSVVDWQWTPQYGLAQTSTVAGLVATTTWWFAGTAAQTISAPVEGLQASTNYRFAGWSVDGLRQPDATNKAGNPALGIDMATSHIASALYLPADLDSQGSGLPDWWQFFYFGTTNVIPGNDADLDGFSNLEEHQDSTDPRDPASYPVPPVITHTPLPDPTALPAPWTVSAVITDNAQVAFAILRWQRNSGGWVSAAMTTGASPHEYVSAIPWPGTNSDDFVYLLEAQDAAGLIATSGPHPFTVAYPILSASATRLDLNRILPEGALSRYLSMTNRGNTNLIWQAEILASGSEEAVETGVNGWTHSGTNDLWHITTNRFYSAEHSWYNGDVISRTYLNNMNASLVSPALRIVDHSTLTIRYWADVEVDTTDARYTYDGGVVEISTNQGLTFVPLAPFGGYPCLAHGGHGSPFDANTPCFAGTGSWQSASFDLTPFGGMEIQLRFRFGSDESYTREGWYVDDVFITPASSNSNWLILESANGVLAGGASTNVSIQFSAAGTTNGERKGAWLRLESNDLFTPTFLFMASMYVGPPVAFTHTPLVNSTNSVDAYPVSAGIESMGPLRTNDLS